MRLNRFLVSTEWDSTFSMAEVEALPRITSDRCPIVMTTCGNRKSAGKIFRLEEVWLKYDDFCANVLVWWNEVDCHISQGS